MWIQNSLTHVLVPYSTNLSIVLKELYPHWVILYIQLLSFWLCCKKSSPLVLPLVDLRRWYVLDNEIVDECKFDDILHLSSLDFLK